MESAEKRAARREWYGGQPWFVECERAVAVREVYRADLAAAAACAPERTRNFIAGADWALAGIAILAALQAVQGKDENGVRRAVPVSGKFLADMLAVLGFGDGLKVESLDRYAKTLLHLLVESKRLVMVRDAKRVTGNANDPDAREWLVYVGGREMVANEPHAEPRCWKKAKVVEQPREPREPREPMPVEQVKRIEAERAAFEKWEADRRTPSKPIRTMTDFVEHMDAGRDGRPHVPAMRRLNGIAAPTPVRPRQKPESRPTGIDLLREIASGRLSLEAARRRGMVT